MTDDASAQYLCSTPAQSAPRKTTDPIAFFFLLSLLLSILVSTIFFRSVRQGIVAEWAVFACLPQRSTSNWVVYNKYYIEESSILCIPAYLNHQQLSTNNDRVKAETDTKCTKANNKISMPPILSLTYSVRTWEGKWHPRKKRFNFEFPISLVCLCVCVCGNANARKLRISNHQF